MHLLLIAVLLIVVIIIVVIVLYNRSKSCESEKLEVKSSNDAPNNVSSDEGKVLIQEILEVSFKDDVFYVNGVQSPKLYLLRDKYYEFRNPTKEPIYITTSSSGGVGMPKPMFGKKVQGLIEGSLILRTTPELPETFYYQSANRKHAGALITLV